MTKSTTWLCAQRRLWSDWVLESSLSAWRKAGSLATHWAQSEDSEQTGQMPRLIWAFAGRTATLLVLSWGGSDTLMLKDNNGIKICIKIHWMIMYQSQVTPPNHRRLRRGGGRKTAGTTWILLYNALTVPVISWINSINYEPEHEKNNKMMCAQQRLGPTWSGFLLGTLWIRRVFGDNLGIIFVISPYKHVVGTH